MSGPTESGTLDKGNILAASPQPGPAATMLRPRSKSDEATAVPSRPVSAPAGRPCSSDPEQMPIQDHSLEGSPEALSAYELGSLRVLGIDAEASPIVRKSLSVVRDYPTTTSTQRASNHQQQQQQQQQQPQQLSLPPSTLHPWQEKHDEHEMKQQGKKIDEGGPDSQSVFCADEDRLSPQESTKASEKGGAWHETTRASMTRNPQISMGAYQKKLQQDQKLQEGVCGSQGDGVEEDSRSPQGSTEAENGGAGYGTARACMPRNFRISFDGYTLQRDAEGTYCAYRINVTAGLHHWYVLRRYRQFISLHVAVAENVRREDMPHLPGKRILGSSIDPAFAEARGLALQVYLRQLVCVSAAWRTPLLIGFLDTRASMMGMQSQISEVLDQVDKMESLCVDLQRQLNRSQMQVERQKEIMETLYRRLQTVEREYAVLHASVQKPPEASPAEPGEEGREGVPPRRRASTGPTITIASAESFVGANPGSGMMRLGYAGASLPATKIDFSDLNNVVKRVESANQLAMKVASDDEDDAVDELLEHQHQIMRSSSAYSLVSIDGGQRGDRKESADLFYMGTIESCIQSIETGGITQGMGIKKGDQEQEQTRAPDASSSSLSIAADPAVCRSTPAIAIPAPASSNMPSNLWERLQKGGSLLGDPEERMMAEGQDESTPGSGLVKDVSRSMFGLASPPPRLSALPAMFGAGNTNSMLGQGTGDSGPLEAEEDPLPLEFLPCNKQPLAIDRRVDDLLRLLRPAPRAEGYRRSVFRFVSRQVKRALGAQCFPVGGYAIQAYLPDEEVGISAFLCHGQEKSWFVRVNETLCKVSSEASGEAAEGGSGDVAEDNYLGVGGGLENEDGLSYRHRLSNVNFINMGHLQKIKCVIDNQVAVDIGANQVGDIATVALLEETDQLLGKNHLFKRSLLLIKSWWVYESRAYTGSNMLSRITEAALATMVLAVVNQHHARLHTPLQVMALFFHIHSRFDWSKHCWCIEGPRRLDTLHALTTTSTGGSGDKDAANHGQLYEGDTFCDLGGHHAPLLLTQEVLERYRLRHTGRNRQRSQGQAQSGRKSPSEQGQGQGQGDLAATGGVSVGGTGAGMAGGNGGEDKDDSVSVRRFPIRNMNVMNPLDSTDNQIDDTVNRRRAARMHSLLQMGARQLRPVLMHLKREVTKAQQGQPVAPHTAHAHSTTTSVGMLETFFSLSWARFGQGWRPDVPPHLDRDEADPDTSVCSAYDHDFKYNYMCNFKHDLIGEGEGQEPGGGEQVSPEVTASRRDVPGEDRGDQRGQRDPFYVRREVDLESVRDSVKYCCFLLEAEVTDSALLALSREILAEKGSLPVGEIGKLLQEATANASLSQTLKDQFGGLKKFLEKHPGEFAIAADHPFNPHVYLKSALTPEEFETVMRGGIVVQTGTSGSGGGKKHKSKSSRRRSAANKQQQQQQQMTGSSQMQAGSIAAGIPQQAQGHHGHFLRGGHHPPMSQQHQHQQRQNQMRGLNDPRYGLQQDKLQGNEHDGGLATHSRFEHPQQHQQSSRLRHCQGNDSGGTIAHGLQPLPHQQHQHEPRRGLVDLGPHLSPRAPSRVETLAQLVSSPNDQRRQQHYQTQHHQQQQQHQHHFQQSRGARVLGGPFVEDNRLHQQQHHQQQQQHRKQQQQEDESLAAMYLQQSAETLAAGDPILHQRNQRTSGGVADQIRQGGRFGTVGGMDGIGGPLPRRQQQQGGCGMLDARWEDMSNTPAEDEGQHQVLHYNELHYNELQDRWTAAGMRGVGALRNDLLVEDESPQHGINLDFRGQGGSRRGIGGYRLQETGIGDGDRDESSPGLLFKTLQHHQRQRQQHQLQLQHEGANLGGGNSPRRDARLCDFLGELRDDQAYYS